MPNDQEQYDEWFQELVARGNYNPGDPPERVKTQRTRCPKCGSSDGLALARGDDGLALVQCFAAGCSFEDIADALGLDTSGTNGGCTREALADYFGIHETVLEEEGWEDADHYSWGGPRVEIPYRDPVTGEVVVRYRLSLDGKRKFEWKRGAKVKDRGLLYSGDDLAGTRGVFLVEGESDALILKRSGGYRAVGLPGANQWSEAAHGPQFASVEKIFVVLEPDSGGAALLSSLAQSAVRDKVLLLRLPGAKDAREFYAVEPATFRARLDTALADAVTIDQYEAEARQLEASLALTETEGLERAEDLLTLLLETVQRRGYVGEQAVIVAVTLALVSTLLRRLINLALKGPSAAGKSGGMDVVRAFFPESYYIYRTAVTPRALLYTDEDYRNRAMMWAEADALADEGVAYIARTLVSEGFALFETVEKDPVTGQMGTRIIKKPGPTSLIVSTTQERLEEQLETRMLSVQADDSAEQTTAVMIASALADEALAPADDDPELKRWRALFTWLRAQDLTRVTIPYRHALATLIPPVAVRMRRDFRTLTSCIEAHALLHRATRATDEQGRVVATLADYAAVRRYLGDAFSENVGATISDDMRETVEAVAAIIERKTATNVPGLIAVVAGSANYKDLAQQLGLDKSTARRRAIAALNAGWLKNEARPRKPAELVPGEPLPEAEGQQHLLPTVEELEIELQRERS